MADPSPFFLEQEQRLRAAARLGPVVDLACGRGRHTLAAARWGLPVIGIDRDAARLAELRCAAQAAGLACAAVRADLETEHGIPVREGSCGAILVFRFLFRPLAAAIVRALRPGGLLLYETFTRGQAERPHGPSSPAFLLAPGELPELFRDLEILEHWEGETPDHLAHLAARRGRA